MASTPEAAGAGANAGALAAGADAAGLAGTDEDGAGTPASPLNTLPPPGWLRI
jgi:hypothetical protein